MKTTDKTSMNELAQLVSDKTGASRIVVDGFLKKLFATVEDGLRADGSVRINNFGTFRLQWNEPRKSVDVNTGEEILIEGYNKVVFLPETFLKDKINEPFAHLETVLLDGDKPDGQPKTEDIPLQKLDMQAEEIKDILADIQEMDAARRPNEAAETAEPQEPTPEKEETQEALASAETPAESDEPAQPQPEQQTETQSNTETMSNKKQSTEEKKQPQPEQQAAQPAATPAVPTKPAQPATPAKPEKSNKGWKIAGWIIVGVLCLLVVLYFVLQKQIEAWADNFLNKQPVTEVVAEPAPQPEPEPSIFDRPRVYTEFITTERLTPGSRLAWLSTKYYGSPYFWVYIYEANKDYILNPSHVLIGTPVKVPVLDAALIDANNPECLEYARKLHEQYIK